MVMHALSLCHACSMLEIPFFNSFEVSYFFLRAELVFVLKELDGVVQLEAKGASKLIVNLFVLAPYNIVNICYILVINLLFLSLDVVF